ncbi:histone-like nucleoid-structuring protein Lsr2 [Microbacterium sp. G2-8]|uniref:AAA domain-containing protein n=2 Tax=Bacillati TaxID=1783272 RepID=UPI0021AA6328|nr:histone-like nucleoid-structuring protein Lsr2 [Microbacterium sp. G2-8]
MQERDAEATAPTVANQVFELLEYLSAAARELGPAPVRDVRKHDVSVWPADLPEHPAVTVGASANGAWMEVKRVAAPELLAVPEELRGILRVGEHITTPQVRPTWSADAITAKAEKRVVEEAGDPGHEDGAASMERTARVRQVRSEIIANVDDWIVGAWEPWADRVRPAFEARALYSQLYDLHLKEDADSATHEVVWGHLLLSWRGESETVLTPMLTTPVMIEVDSLSAAIRVVAEKPLELELDVVEGTDLPGVEGLVRLQAEVRDSPPDPWDVEARQQARQQIIAPLGVDAHLSESREPERPTFSPRLDDGWVIVKRRRPMRQERFYDELAHKLGDEDLVPEALASVVADRDQVDEAVRESGQDVSTDDGTADRLMMPLPTNAEQERIARQLATSRGVTVQGPPGTGKSHTIVNLVSHLVAQGKRVLVTAEKEQALSVLRDKIPEPLRDLSIAVLGSTPAAMEELRSSAQAMQDSLSSIDVSRETNRSRELGTRIDELREQIRLTDAKLVEALRSEQREYPLPSGPARAPQVAEWLAKDRDLDIVDDAVAPEVRFPLTDDEVHELVGFLRTVSSADSEASLQDLPTDEWIPTQTDLEERWRRQQSLRDVVTTLEDDGLNVAGVDSIDVDTISATARYARESADALTRLGGPWEAPFAQAIRESSPAVAWMMPHNSTVQEQLQAVRGHADRLAGHVVEVPDGDPAIQNALLREWHGRITAGKKISAFARRDLKDLNAQTRVDNYPVTTTPQLDLVWTAMDQRVRLRGIHTLMRQTYEPLGIPVPPFDPSFQFAAERTAARVAQLHTWWTETYRALTERLQPLVAVEDPASQPQRLTQAAELLDRAAARAEERALTATLQTLKGDLAERSQRAGSSPVWGDLVDAVDFARPDKWGSAIDEARRLLAVRAKATRAGSLLSRIAEAGAPKWARQLRETRADEDVTGDLEHVELAWDRARARTWLVSLHKESDVDALMSRSHADAQELRRAITDLASRSARVELKQNIKDRQRRALDVWLTAVRRVGKGTGKNAPRFRAAARDALPAAMGAVPVWIMPIYRVLENFDPRRSELFDVVVVDESSQCDLLTLGVLALGKKAVIVGDDKQTTPNLVGIDTSRIAALQDQHLRSVQEAKLLTVDESLYSIASRAFPSLIALKEHFRCVPEIIRFSNRYYDGAIKPLRELSVSQIGDPVRVVRVEEAVSERIGSNRVNRREAEAVADQVAACIADRAYDGLTFGVVTMMSGPQAQILQDMIRDRIGDAEFERRRMRVGNPPLFQGDERNVIFISMVAHDNSSAATRLWHAQWANVAASRAQDQLWVFHSMDPATLNHQDERRAMIEYARGVEHRDETEDLFDLTESKFERDVLQQMLDRGYEVEPQHQVGSYRIDFVVRVAPGERLAVECDGDSFHGPDKWDEDVRRQRVLERLGWTFWRVRASAYYLDPSASMQALWDRLGEMRERAAQKEARRRSSTPIEIADASQGDESTGERVDDDAFEAGADVEVVPVGPVGADHERAQNGGRFSRSRVEPDDGSLRSSRDQENPDPADVRRWARANGYEIGDRGRVAHDIRMAYVEAHRSNG